ncbi:putative ras family small gtpase protein [Eutypa lata UCREL1]|uniref:small monomeric GTPase n=1 Tax=Eutypa lata (strain UCR-EL1) TaxID=1287681 RepID=M7SB60_EUTLA|nr:putative ras family small gtpase protein [Eutypa lata UCREL1]
MSGSIVWTDEEAQYLRAVLAWRSSKAQSENHPTAETKAPIGEFRFLIIGAERRVVQIEEQAYVVDALELRSEHLSNDSYLRQAIAITEAAILIYDVTARKSFDIMAAVTEVIRDAVETREYGLVLVGNKSDCEEERQVSWAEGHRLAASLRIRCSFAETSALKGDNVDKIFPQLGKDVLKLRWLMKQRREQEERLSMEGQDDVNLPVKRRPRWRNWTRPWFHRRLEERKASMV